VPDVVADTSHVLITEWMDGTPLSKIISDGSQEVRDGAGLLFVRFLFSGPARAGLLHADPHPGNFRLLADGRLGVLDFGAVDRLPDGLPPFIGRLLRIVHDGGDLGPAEQELREQGFIREGIDFDPEALRIFLAPLAEPSRVERFRFSREWLRGEATRVTDPRASNMGRRLNLPPSYVLIHRVSTAGMGVLCQLECEGPYRTEMLRWMPGYSDADRRAGGPTADAVSLAPVEPNGVSVAPAESNGAGAVPAELNGAGPAPREPDGAGAVPAELNGAGPAPHEPNGAGATPAGLNGARPAPGPDGASASAGEPDAVSPAL
jgi:hypothetical protein